MTTYLYLIEQDKIIGVVKTKNLTGINEDISQKEASHIFDNLSKELGEARQENYIRRGGEGFILARADIWEDISSAHAIYFIATHKEIVLAVIEDSNFPLDQIFIRPDEKRFPLKDNSNPIIYDMGRPNNKTQKTLKNQTENPQQDARQRIEQTEKSQNFNLLLDKNSISQKENEAFSLQVVLGTLLLLTVGFVFTFYRRCRK